jgi:hypothetical protein
VVYPKLRFSNYGRLAVFRKSNKNMEANMAILVVGKFCICTQTIKMYLIESVFLKI